MFDQLVMQLAEELEMEVPKKEEGNFFNFPLNPETTVKIRQLDPGVSFWAKIAPCPTVKKEELFILLMKGNFLGQGTGGAVIALDENENFLTLSSILPYDMNYKTFKEALEDFANYLDFWREELVRHNKNA